MLNLIYELRKKAKESGNPILRDKSFELLLETVKKHNPKHILEIGVNTGLSGIAMLLNSNANLTGIEIDDDAVLTATKNYELFGVEKRAKIFRGDAGEIIPVLTGEYDFIFLDGPKGHYYEYLPYLLSILKKGGVLFSDNVLFRGYVFSKEKTPQKYNTTRFSMEKFLTALQEDKTLTTKIYDIEDGVSITVKNQ